MGHILNNGVDIISFGFPFLWFIVECAAEHIFTPKVFLYCGGCQCNVFCASNNLFRIACDDFCVKKIEKTAVDFQRIDFGKLL